VVPEAAEVPVLPFWPVPEPLPLVPLAVPVVEAPVRVPLERVITPLLPLPLPPVGPPAMVPPVAVPSALIQPVVPASITARHTELVAIRR
jgi:hypothetical protein